MSERPPPSPEGQLITAALERKRPKISVAEAARRAGISRARWQQITSGYQMVSGTPVGVVAPADTLARMARVVGVTASELRKAGRTDAAHELEEMELEAEDAGKSTAEIQNEVDAIVESTEETLRQQGRTIDERQRRALSRWAMNLVDTLDAISDTEKAGR